MTTLRRAGALPGVPRACPLGLALLLLALTLAEAARAAEPCVPEIARIVSMQGPVQVQRGGIGVWTEASLEQSLCIGDRVRVGALGRAALAFVDDSVLRLDQHTTLHLRGVGEQERTLLDLVLGAVYFFSHRPRALEIGTPFVNAGTEGTEFFVRVGEDFTRIIMFEGRVRAVNPLGELLLAAGEAALARAGAAPRPEIVVRPRDAVAWALYYPPIFAVLAGRDALPEDLPAPLRTATLHAAENRYAQALEVLDEVPPAARDARYWAFRAGLLLNVGRVEEAEDAIGRALELEPDAGDALAQRAIIEIVRNQPEAALASARRAVELSPDSAPPHIALSYALQATLQLDEAREALREAADAFPGDALVWARLAEVELARGWLNRALDAAERAAALAPGLGRTQMVLGFAHLARIDPGEARAAFAHAIQLEPANPLSRLGLGLARIRQSELAAGRHEIEIATALDPNHSLIRSYLGKAYFEETREDLAGEQLPIAKQLDPNDPTPWFYDAIRKQLENRPVEALRDLEAAIALNDNRAIYRSRLLLDQDLAARSVSLARIYHDLGFEALAQVEAATSLTQSPGSASAHRFLADSYADRPRHEIARTSELLQSQLLQPLTINPVQPRLVVSDLSTIAGSGPADGAFREFHPLFERDRAQLTATGIAGTDGILGNEILGSVLWRGVSLSAGQFHFQDDGFRPNNDERHDLYNLFGQVAVSPAISLQAEYRRRESEHGDLELVFDPDFFLPTDRREIKSDILRAGGRLAPQPGLDFLIHAGHVDRKERIRVSEEDFAGEVAERDQGYQVESQVLSLRDGLNLVVGGGFYDVDVAIRAEGDFIQDFPEPLDFPRKQASIYLYNAIDVLTELRLLLGISYDSFEQGLFEANELNPKLGLIWQPIERLRLRGAYFETLKRALPVDQTIEPTHVAGFNQFYDDDNGTRARNVGFGIDYRFASNWYAGFEFLQREIDRPRVNPVTTEATSFEDQDERIYRGYVYWTPTSRWALSSGIVFDTFKRDSEGQGFAPEALYTLTVPLDVRYFDPSGWFAQVVTRFTYQDVDRVDDEEDSTVGTESFVVVDVAVGYRLPNRRGIVSLEGHNLFNADFRFQDDNFRTSEVRRSPLRPDRTALGRLTLHF